MSALSQFTINDLEDHKNHRKGKDVILDKEHVPCGQDNHQKENEDDMEWSHVKFRFLKERRRGNDQKTKEILNEGLGNKRDKPCRKKPPGKSPQRNQDIESSQAAIVLRFPADQLILTVHTENKLIRP